MTAWLLTFFLFGQQHFIPGIADEKACHALAARIADGVIGHDITDYSYVKNGHKCVDYKIKDIYNLQDMDTR